MIYSRIYHLIYVLLFDLIAIILLLLARGIFFFSVGTAGCVDPHDP
jgi:hypothetical protein